MFPFSYKSEVHHSCVEVEDGGRWCSTNTTADGQFVPGHWGFCGETCYFDTPTPLTSSGKVRLRQTEKYISVLSGITQSVSRDGKDVTGTTPAGPVLMVSSATKTQAVSPSSTSSPVTTVLIQTSGTTSTLTSNDYFGRIDSQSVGIFVNVFDNFIIIFHIIWTFCLRRKTIVNIENNYATLDSIMT